MAENGAVKGYNFKDLYNKTFGQILTKQHQHTPEQVYNAAVAYFTWAEDNAIKAAETASFQGVTIETQVFKARVFTLNGFMLFMGVTRKAIDGWRKEDHFSEVMEFVDSVIYEQKYQLAASGIVNSGFIGKDLGIDKPATITIDNQSAAVATSQVGMKAAVKSVLDKI